MPTRGVPWSRFPFAYIKKTESFFVSMEDEKQTSLLGLKNLLYRKSREYLIATSASDKYSLHIDRKNKGVRVFRIE